MFEIHECKLFQFAIFIFWDFHLYYWPSLVEELEEELLRHLRLQVAHEQSAVGLGGRRPHFRVASSLGPSLTAHSQAPADRPTLLRTLAKTRVLSFRRHDVNALRARPQAGYACARVSGGCVFRRGTEHGGRGW